MQRRKLCTTALLVMMTSMLFSASMSSFAAPAKKVAVHPVKVVKQKLVIQVSDADPKKWALALNNAANVQEDLGNRVQ